MGLERGTWPGLALSAAVVAAPVLLLTSGPVSTTSVRGPADVVRLEYQQVIHQGAPAAVVVVVDPAALPDGRFTMEMTGRWAEQMEIERVTPAPEQMRAVPDGLRWEWPAGAVPTSVVVTARPAGYGLADGLVRVGRHQVAFDQFVMP